MKTWIEETIPVVFDYGNVGESVEFEIMLSCYSPNKTIPDNYDYMFPKMDEKTFSEYKTEYMQSILNTNTDSESTVCGYIPGIDYNCMSNVLEIAEFKSNGCIATAILLLHSNKNTEKIGAIYAKQFSEPVSHVKIQSKFGNIDEVIERECNWAAMIDAVYKIDGIRFGSVVFGNSIVPFFAKEKIGGLLWKNKSTF